MKAFGKGVLLLLAVVVFTGVASGMALATEKIGVIDPQKIMFNHPKFEETQKKIQQIVEAKQNEAKMAIETESDNKKKADIYQKKREEAATEQNKLMEPLFKDVDLAMRAVAKAKGITLVLDKGMVFFGGEDITNDIIQELKKSVSK